MEENISFWEALFVILFVPTRNYLFKVSNWSTMIGCENCSKLRMKTIERCQWRRSSFYIVNCKHISNILLIIHFEQAKVCWVRTEKINTFQDKIRYIMRYVVVVKCDQNLLTKSIWSYTTTTLWMNQWDIFAKEFTSDVDSG